jgi:hypothetical protein
LDAVIQMAKTIIENGVKVYLNHFCKHCGERIPVRKSNEKNGIPDFIYRHQNAVNSPFRKGNKWRFKEGHTLSQGEKNGMYVDGRRMKRKGLAFPKSF